jgi:hypothetical protein
VSRTVRRRSPNPHYGARKIDFAKSSQALAIAGFPRFRGHLSTKGTLRQSARRSRRRTPSCHAFPQHTGNARSSARLNGSSAGCLPASPCALRSALCGGPRRSAPAGRRRRGRRGARSGDGGASGRQPPPSHRSTPHLEVVHRLNHERVAGCPVVAPAGDQPDAHRVPASHEPVAVVLDLVNPVGAGRGLVGWGWQAGLNEAGPVSRQALTHTLNQHAANLGSRSEESNHRGRATPPAQAASSLEPRPFSSSSEKRAS